MAGQPFTDIGVFVGAIVVQDRMDGLVVRNLALDLVEKTEEFLMAVTGGIVADNGAGQHIERGKEGRSAMALLWLPPVMQELSDRLVACDRVRTSIRPRCAAFPEAAGRDGDLRIRSKSCKRAYELEAPHWFSRSRSV